MLILIGFFGLLATSSSEKKKAQIPEMDLTDRAHMHNLEIKG